MSDTGGQQPADSSEELEQLRQQNAELQQQLADAQSSGGWRMALAGVFVVLFSIILVPANQAVWIASTVLETDRFVATFAPLPADEAVADALGQRVSIVVSEEAAIEERIATLLGSELEFVAAPIASGIEDLIAGATSTVIQSDIFTGIWENALRITHASAIAIVDASREGPVGVTGDGQIVLDLNPLLEQVVAELDDRGIPSIDTESVDATIVLYESESAGIVQSIITVIYSVRWIAPIAVIILLVAAIWVATDRRRVLSWLGIGAVVAGLISLVIVRFARNEIIEGIADATQKEGAEAAWSIVFDQLLAQTWAIILLGVIAILVAWFFGSSDRATGLRDSFMTARAEASEDREPNAVTDFLTRYGRVLQWGTVALGVVFLLLVPVVRGWVVLVTAIVVIGIVVAIEWIAGGSTGSKPGPTDSSESERTDSESLDA